MRYTLIIMATGIHTAGRRLGEVTTPEHPPRRTDTETPQIKCRCRHITVRNHAYRAHATNHRQYIITQASDRKHLSFRLGCTQEDSSLPRYACAWVDKAPSTPSRAMDDKNESVKSYLHHGVSITAVYLEAKSWTFVKPLTK